MNWFTHKPAQDLPLADQTPVPGWGDQFAAGSRMQRNEDDHWSYLDSDRYLRRIAGQLGVEFDPKLHRTFRQRSGYIYSEIAKARDASAGAWPDLPATPEQFQEYVTAVRKAEHAADRQVLDSAPDDSWGGFFGQLWGGFTHQSNLATLPVGAPGGAGIAKTIGMEAVGAAVGEAATVESRRDVAERLDLPKPNPVADIAEAAAVGGAFGGVVGVAGRVIDHGLNARSGREVESQAELPIAPSEGLSPGRQEAAMEGTRAALDDGLAPARSPLAGSNGYGYDEAATLRSIIGVESGGKATAQNPNSTARGLGQFTEGTWLETVRKHRPDLMQGKTQNQVLGLRDNPGLNAEMTRHYMRDNADHLRARGLPTTPGEIYLAHFMGPGGAVKALQAPLDTPIARLMSPAEISANAGIRFGGKSFAEFTAGDLRRWSRHKMRYAYDPSAAGDVPDFSAYGTSRGYTGAGQVSVGDDFRIDVGYEVVDASDLQRAYGRFQPRDRSRVNSDAWVADTAARLDPAQLMPSPTADRGAPIVGPDGMIESGNGRFSAIERAYARHPDRASAYRQQIEAAGYQIPDGVERPVLIARRRTELGDDAREAMTVAAQDSGVARMTPTEIARASARAMTADRLGSYHPGARLTAPDNRSFLNSVLAALPRSERNALFDGDGALNAEGARRMRHAFFARAWDDADLTSRYAEAEDAGELKSLLDALEAAAPSWAVLRAEIDAGSVRQEFDITGHVVEAMRLIATAREAASGGRARIADVITELLDDVDLLDGAVSPLTARLVGKFWKENRPAPAAEIAGFLTRYADEARSAGRVGDAFGASPADVLRQIGGDSFADLPEDFGRPRGARPAPAGGAEISGSAFANGADSPEAIDADAVAAEALRQSNGPFGPVFRDIEDDPEAAIARLMEARTGEVPTAFRHPDPRIGDVSMVYGTPGYGLRHIEARHPEMIAEIPRLLREGQIVEDSEGLKRIYLTDDAIPPSVMAIRLDWDGAEKTWIVTSFRDEQGQVARHLRTSNEPDASASSRIPDATGPNQNSATGTNLQPDDIRNALDEAQAEFGGDLRFTLEEGGPELTARNVLDQVDADEDLSEILHLCNPGGAA